MKQNFAEGESESIWALYGLKGNPFSTKPLSIYGGDIPLETFFGRQRELQHLMRIVASSENSRVLVSGDVGVGKTTFVNYIRSTLAQKKYFITPREIPVQSNWTADDFLLNTLANIYNTLSLKEDLHSKAAKHHVFKTLKTIFDIEQGGGWNVNIVSVGGGIQHNLGQPVLTTSSLIQLYQKTVEMILGMGFKKVVLHYNNLELSEEFDEDKMRKILNDIRDFLQINDTHFILVGNRTVPPVLNSVPRVAQIFDGIIYLDSFSVEEISEIIQKRLESLKLKNFKYITPCDKEVIAILHKLYEGNTRNILHSLNVAIVDLVSDSPIVLTKDTMSSILHDAAKEKYSSNLQRNAMEILNEMLKHKEVTNKQISTNLRMRAQNVSKYLNDLKNAGAIVLCRKDGRERFYRPAIEVYWLLLPHTTGKQTHINRYY